MDDIEKTVDDIVYVAERWAMPRRGPMRPIKVAALEDLLRAILATMAAEQRDAVADELVRMK
jgi:HD superfamily phosphohydrolase YqeK